MTVKKTCRLRRLSGINCESAERQEIRSAANLNKKIRVMFLMFLFNSRRTCAPRRVHVTRQLRELEQKEDSLFVIFFVLLIRRRKQLEFQSFPGRRSE